MNIFLNITRQVKVNDMFHVGNVETSCCDLMYTVYASKQNKSTIVRTESLSTRSCPIVIYTVVQKNFTLFILMWFPQNFLTNFYNISCIVY